MMSMLFLIWKGESDRSKRNGNEGAAMLKSSSYRNERAYVVLFFYHLGMLGYRKS